jgi:hypothetical protein
MMIDTEIFLAIIRPASQGLLRWINPTGDSPFLRGNYQKIANSLGA